MTRIAATILAVTLSTGALYAKAPLSQVDYINDRLFAAAVGDVIRKECSSISARWTKVLSELSAIKSYAKNLGYSEDEIEAYTQNDAEKSKMKARRDVYLRKAGATPGNAQSYCEVGRSEIAKKSLIGSLLKAR